MLELVERFALAKWGQDFRVLDVGCGWGHYGVLIGDQWPWARVEGIDARPYNVRHSGYESLRPAILPDGMPWQCEVPYDLVLFLDVIEHLDKDDGKCALAWCRRRGPVILATPNGFMQQDGDEYDRHRSGWEPDELLALGARDLKIVDTHVRPDGGSGQIVCLFDQEG